MRLTQIAPWRKEEFPYPAWQFRKFELYHNREISEFFEPFKSAMGLGHSASGRQRSIPGKEFFNSCKLAVLKSGSSLSEEINFMEATVRFFAGIFFVFEWAIRFLLILLITQIVDASVTWNSSAQTELALLNPAAFSVALIAILWTGNRIILRRMRTLRCKEVDTVYDSFFQTHRRDSIEQPEEADACNDFGVYREMLVEATKRSGDTTVKLSSLLEVMREKSLEHPFTSCVYFAGGRGDHPFFLSNESVAVGLSILPEDTDKAGTAKRHPHQVEVLFVLHGRIILHLENRTPRELHSGDHFVIDKGICHRITPDDDTDGRAAFLFVKTNPMKLPHGEHCDV